ncbi:restriction endonuclease subunit S [Aquibium oceanicum]|uniref:Type I restriction modification DNA specificity domain-containing protein n=1 Tax=Aquibium oceanicum TaxID=1670800 RepID=A0A1L3SVQ1_9HYPH|nr:restriction endonuclease subunit S [Aquibium oceanicum]APH73424.1 hypothetical protein BSQ44_20150 [Aquibium oceanicum]
MSFPFVRLLDVCYPRQWKIVPNSQLTSTGYPVYGANGKIGYYSEYTHAEPTLMITCRGATCGTINLSEPFSYISGNAMALDRLDEKRVDQKYLRHCLEHRGLGDAVTGAAQPQITRQNLDRVAIPLPPLDEQKRIAAILDKADQLRQKRRQAIALLDSLTQSIFLEMFGDPVSNPKEWAKEKLADVADFLSGGTPSKSSPSFWVGQIPWVSPKDMKTVIIRNAIDHISETAVRQSAVKLAPANAVLIVVRGMILAHSVPVGILAREAAFNQDIKSIVFHEGIDPRFGLWNLLSQRSAILQEVSTAAHGTKRLDMDALSKIPVLCPPIDLQKVFTNHHDKILRSLAISNEALFESEGLFRSLQHTLFSREADDQ